MNTEVDTRSHVLDHYHCTFFLPLTGLDETSFHPEKSLAKVYNSPSSQPEEVKAVGATAGATAILEGQREKQSESEAIKKTKQDELFREAQAYRFFSPALRNILFDPGETDRCGLTRLKERCSPGAKAACKLTPIKEWRLPNTKIENWQLRLGCKGENGDSAQDQVAVFSAVTLYRYFNGIYLLSFRVEPKALRELRQSGSTLIFSADHTSDSLKHLELVDPDNAERYRQLQLESWLRFTRLARIIYPSFPQQFSEGKIAAISLETNKNTFSAFDSEQELSISYTPGDDLSPIISFLLKEFDNECCSKELDLFLQEKLKLYDDRLFVSAAYGLAGQKLPEDTLDRLYCLALFSDRHVDGYDEMGGFNYTPAVIKLRAEDYSMRLWEGLGGRYGFTDSSNIYLYRGSSFRAYIAPDHIPLMYDRMLVQALLYRASLYYYDDQICKDTGAMLANGNLEAIREQRGDFIRFTNQYWFHSVTEQMQGKEIFELQQKALGLKKHYDIIKDELERTDEYMMTEHEHRLSKLSKQMTVGGVVIAFLALYYSILSLLPSYLTTTEIKGLVAPFMPQCFLDWVVDNKGVALLGTLLLPPFLLLMLALGKWLVGCRCRGSSKRK